MCWNQTLFKCSQNCVTSFFGKYKLTKESLTFVRKEKLVQLIFEITSSRISAFQWDGTSLLALESLTCPNKTDFGYKETFLQLIDALPSDVAYENFSCSYASTNFTLVPSPLFATNKLDKLLQFTQSELIPKGETDYNRLLEWNAVAVYQLPLWIKSVLIVKYPRIVIQHELTHVLRGLQGGAINSTKIEIVLQEAIFLIVIRKGGAIVHATAHVYQAIEDVLFQTLTCIQKLAISDKTVLTLSTSQEDTIAIANQFVALASKLPPFNLVTFDVSPYKHIQYQTLCV
jgi:hypothetical protein